MLEFVVLIFQFVIMNESVEKNLNIINEKKVNFGKEMVSIKKN